MTSRRFADGHHLLWSDPAASATITARAAMTEPTVSGGNDPRVYFAAERTLLAWLRTGLAVVGLGFIVARFGLFLSALRAAEHVDSRPIASALIGVAFVLLGTLMIAVACWQHVRFCRHLPADQKPEHYSLWMSQFIALIVLLVCTALAAYLLLSTSW